MGFEVMQGSVTHLIIITGKNGFDLQTVSVQVARLIFLLISDG